MHNGNDCLLVLVYYIFYVTLIMNEKDNKLLVYDYFYELLCFFNDLIKSRENYGFFKDLGDR